MLIDNAPGGFSFLKGISPYSAGAVAMDGFEIEHMRFPAPLALQTGFAAVEARLKALGRPIRALCGMELRSPKPFTFTGFNQFNAGYVNVLRGWGILLDGGVNPVARTNIAPEVGWPAEPSLYGFSYTVPSQRRGHTFVVAGAGELPEGSLDPHDVVRRGETSEAALREKAKFVMGLMSGRLKGLGVSWAEVTAIDVYTVHPICGWLADELVRPAGKAQLHGLTWYYSRPPIESIEFEMDLRGCAREVML
jgi:hypothetical protein